MRCPWPASAAGGPSQRSPPPSELESGHVAARPRQGRASRDQGSRQAAGGEPLNVGHDRAGSLRGSIEFTDIPFKEVLWILDKLESAHSCQQMTAIWSCDDESSTGA